MPVCKSCGRDGETFRDEVNRSIARARAQGYVSKDEFSDDVNRRMSETAIEQQLAGVDKILAEREKTHGDFPNQARITQGFKDCLRYEEEFVDLTDTQAEALDMIVHKIARIFAGDPNFVDHWDDIAGYATLIANELRQTA